MGWASGSELASKMIHVLERLHDGDIILVEAMHDLIVYFEQQDCDNLYECIGESEFFDEAYYQMYPEEINPDDPFEVD